MNSNSTINTTATAEYTVDINSYCTAVIPSGLDVDELLWELADTANGTSPLWEVIDELNGLRARGITHVP